jgi:hypothetical protein
LEVDGGANCGVLVTGWGRDSACVVVQVEGRARTEERAQELATGVRLMHQGARLSVQGPDCGEGEDWWAIFDVLAPRTLPLEVSAQNHPVAVQDMDARMEIETVNSPLVLKGLSGDVRAHTQNGWLGVTLTGTHWRGARLDASTENGPLTLVVPRGYSCRLETGTLSGPRWTPPEDARTDTLAVRLAALDFRNLHVTVGLGNGGALVRAVTIKGHNVSVLFEGTYKN